MVDVVLKVGFRSANSGDTEQMTYSRLPKTGIWEMFQGDGG